MRLRPDDPGPFVELVRAGVRKLTVPEGPASHGAFAVFTLRGLELQGTVMSGDVLFLLKHSALIGGFVWTRGEAALRWSAASKGRVRFEVALDSKVHALHGAPSGEASCAELSLEPDVAVDFSALRAWLRGKHLHLIQWRSADRVPLSLTPGAEPVAEIDTRADEAETETDWAYLIETRGSSKRIVYQSGPVFVTGWVPAHALYEAGESVASADLTTLGNDPNGPYDPLGHDDPTRPLETSHTASFCAWNAPLSVETEGSAYRVGRIGSAIPLTLGERRGALRQVSFEHPAVSYDAARVHFLVPEQSLYPCGGGDSSAYGVVSSL